jgi:hypothetical protein
MASTRELEEKQPGDKPAKAAAEKGSLGKKKPGEKSGFGKLNVKRVRLGLAALLVLAALVVGAIALLGGSDESESASGGSEFESNAVALSASELLAKAGALSGPVFWIGPRAGTDSYEFSSTPDGRVYIRYLTGGAEAGDPRADFLTVGTYPVPEAAQALADAAKSGEGGRKLSQHEGYEVLSSKGSTNAYVVFEDQPELQIEVFSPQPGEAATLAASGVLKPVE